MSGMTYMPNRLAASPPLSSSVDCWLTKFAEADLAAARALSSAARPKFFRLCAVAISKLGNGWIYPILAATVLAEWGWMEGRRLVLLAAVNAATMHIMYPLIKKRFKRLRPFKADPQLPSLLKTLDEHSFPSGHAMTLTGVLSPLVMFWPSAFASAVVMACCMAWSRIATGHHYPSDVAAGVALGIGVGYPLSANLAAFF